MKRLWQQLVAYVRGWFDLVNDVQVLKAEITLLVELCNGIETDIKAAETLAASRRAEEASIATARKLNVILEDSEMSDRLASVARHHDPALGPLNRGR